MKRPMHISMTLYISRFIILFLIILIYIYIESIYNSPFKHYDAYKYIQIICYIEKDQGGLFHRYQEIQIDLKIYVDLQTRIDKCVTLPAQRR